MRGFNWIFRYLSEKPATLAGTAALLLAALMLHAHRAIAEEEALHSGSDRNAFFQKESVRDIFAPQPELLDANGFEYFPPQNQPEPEEDEFVAEPTPPPPAAQPVAKTPNEEKLEQLAKISTRDDVVAKFGDPAQDTPVLPKNEDAPMPMRGMLAAMQIGDDEMAFQYARQYVRYMKDLQISNTKTLSLVNLAARREGLIEPESKEWSRAPVLVEHQDIYQRDVAAEKAAKEAEAEELVEGEEQLSQDELDAVALIRKAERLEGLHVLPNPNIPVARSKRADQRINGSSAAGEER